MINKFQNFSGKSFSLSCDKEYLLLTYDSSKSNRLPSYVWYDCIFYQIVSIFKGSDFLVLYKPTSATLKQLLDFYSDYNSFLFIEFIYDYKLR